MDAIETYFDESVAVLQRMRADPAILAKVQEAASACTSAVRNGGKILFCGNGGSAADAQHFAAELVSRFNYDRPGMASIALTVDSSILTGVGNDYGYERVFARQVEALGRTGDILIGISTSGQSANVIEALSAARKAGLATIGFTGRDGGAMAALCEIEIRIPSGSTPLIQQGHAVVGHLICALVERAIHPRAG